MNTLNGIELPKGLFWHDSYDYVSIKQVNHKSITGRTLIFRSSLQDGRPINLTGTETSNSITQTQVKALSALRGEVDTLTLVFNGNEYKVNFDFADQGHFKVSPLWNDTNSKENESLWYITSIKLIEVLK